MGKIDTVKKCGKHQIKEWYQTFWRDIYSFDWDCGWGFSFLEALNCWHSLPEERRKQIEKLHHKRFCNDDIANWYVGML